MARTQVAITAQDLRALAFPTIASSRRRQRGARNASRAATSKGGSAQEFLEQGTVDLLTLAKVDQRLQRERLVHDGFGAGVRRPLVSSRSQGPYGQWGVGLRSKPK